MIHKNKSELAGKQVKLKAEAEKIGGQTILIEDWFDRVGGISWMHANGNPACLAYAMRSGFSDFNIPTDNEVLYGKINNLGYLVHITELEIPSFS